VTIALFLATLVGLLLGLFGGGGSLLSVAVLSFGLGMSAKAAVAASLLIVGVTSTAALLAQRDLVSVRTGTAFGGAGMIGAFAGGRLAALLPEAVLLTAFGVVLSLTSIAMLRLAPVNAGAVPPVNETAAAHGARVLTLALGIGFVTGLLGAGGGFLIVPALVLHRRMPMKRAVATSLLVIALQSFAGFVGHLGGPKLNWAVVVPFTLMATLGSVLGATLSNKAPQPLLRRGFAALTLLFGIAVLVRELPSSH
jgi:uncharacterized protein